MIRGKQKKQVFQTLRFEKSTGKQYTENKQRFILNVVVSILQNAIAFKSNHSNTMLPNMMVLALLQKLKIKYELSYQSTTRLKYIDKFDQLLIIHQCEENNKTCKK
jgi:hypothetical protein